MVERDVVILSILISLSFLPLLSPFYIKYVVFNPVVALLTISLSRFVAATGAFSIYIIASIFIARRISPRYKRKKDIVYRIRRFLVAGGFIYLLLLVIYYVLSILYGPSIMDVSNIVFGLLLAMITSFIIPFAKGDAYVVSESELRNLLRRANFVSLGIKKVFYEKLVRNYGEALAIEFITLKLKIDRVRERILYWVFIALILASFPLFPLFILGTWILLRAREKKMFRAYLRWFLLVFASLLIAYAVVLSLTVSVEVGFFAYTIPYIVGLLIPLYVYVKNLV